MGISEKPKLVPLDKIDEMREVNDKHVQERYNK